MTTTTAIAAQTVETTCDECAGDGQLAYDLEATMWVPRSATADWPADDRIGISVLDCLQCDGTGTVRLDPDTAIVRRDLFHARKLHRRGARPSADCGR